MQAAPAVGRAKQRVAIARAFAGDPRIVVCDEPTSALDVSVQAAILNLLSELQLESTTSYLFICHDLGVVRYLADRIAVMYLGRIMEVGTTEKIFDGPHHPYTEALLSAVPSVDGEARARIRLDGEIPSPANPPSGCVFHTRCHRFIAGLCDVTEPPVVEVEPGHLIRCHLPVEELRRLPEPGGRDGRDARDAAGGRIGRGGRRGRSCRPGGQPRRSPTPEPGPPPGSTGPPRRVATAARQRCRRN